MAQISLVERNLEECAAGQAGELHETEAFLECGRGFAAKAFVRGAREPDDMRASVHEERNGL